MAQTRIKKGRKKTTGSKGRLRSIKELHKDFDQRRAMWLRELREERGV